MDGWLHVHKTLLFLSFGYPTRSILLFVQRVSLLQNKAERDNHASRQEFSDKQLSDLLASLRVHILLLTITSGNATASAGSPSCSSTTTPELVRQSKGMFVVLRLMFDVLL